MPGISDEIEKVRKEKSDRAKRKAEKKIFDREQAYKAIFDPESPMAMMVLEDLSKFCRASEVCFDADPRVHAFKEGRREVWLRISQHLNLSSQQLWQLFTNTKFGD